jgi:septal ring factor EnvC (AmiA/AmiB activator)
MISTKYYKKTIMKRAAFILAALMILSTSVVHAQNPNRERLNAYRIAFFTQKLNLTPKEAEKFWPVYNDYQERKNNIQQERTQMNRTFNQNAGSMTDKELTDLGDKYIGLEVQEAVLSQGFYNNMKEILPPAKIFRYYQAENQYKLLLLNELQNRRQERLNPGQR